MNAKALKTELQQLADPAIAEHSRRFFKTGVGDYGYGDKFLGIRVPALRKLAKNNRQLSLSETLKLLKSPYHEVRLFALLVWVYAFEKADEDQRTRIYTAYLAHTRFVNNWDLVDSSAHPIVGEYLMDKDRASLVTLARSESLWERRIAIIATYRFIRQAQFSDTFRIAEELLHDEEDLIHKAVGWMLREVGNRDKALEVSFLQQHYTNMPRTLLRYAIEKFSAAERRAYLAGDV